jgi:hypothetical protein
VNLESVMAAHKNEGADSPPCAAYTDGTHREMIPKLEKAAT